MPRFRKSQGMQGFESRGQANLRPNQVSAKLFRIRNGAGLDNIPDRDQCLRIGNSPMPLTTRRPTAPHS